MFRLFCRHKYRLTYRVRDEQREKRTYVCEKCGKTIDQEWVLVDPKDVKKIGKRVR